MPNGKPGDHPLTDIAHGLSTFSPAADEMIRQLVPLDLGGNLWDLLYGVYREGDAIQLAGKPGRMPLAAFEQFLRRTLDKVSELALEERDISVSRALTGQRAWLENQLSA